MAYSAAMLPYFSPLATAGAFRSSEGQSSSERSSEAPPDWEVRDVYSGTESGVTAANDLTELITEARVRSLHRGSQATSASTGVANDLGDASAALGNGRLARGAGVLGQALAPVSVVAGALDTRQAFSDLARADSLGEVAEAGSRGVSSAASTVSGGAGLIAAGAGASRFAGLSRAAAVAGTAAKVSGVAGGVAGLAEGGFQVYQGAKECDLGKVGRGALKSGAGGLMLAGVATANPFLLAAGGALYAGTALWENREAIGQGVKKGVEVVTEAGRAVGETVGQGARAVARGVERAADGAGQVAGAAMNRVRSVGQTARKALGALF